ncbi:MAG: nitroreductase family protein [Thermoguttaceae bacterium]|nr:nitroreductase family protein [Thermoguttaceae bacterium]MBR5758313.1 nitroreductase family protein [Thermoguttaceae bacterium]
MTTKRPWTIEVDAKRCVRCGSCVNDCLAKIVVMRENELPQTVPDGEARCFKCRHCLAICPTGALSWNGETPDSCASISETPKPTFMENLLRQRRSVRAYRRENVSEEVFDRLVKAMDYAPTGCNDRAFFFSYSRTLETTDACRAAFAQYLTSRSDEELPEEIRRYGKFREALAAGEDVFFRNAAHFVAVSVLPEARDAHIDPYIAASQFELLACSFGLGTCWDGMATNLFNAVPELYQRLHIPDQYELKIVLLFGVPAVRYARAPFPPSYPKAFVSLD